MGASKKLGSCSGAGITFLPNSSSGSMLDLYALVWSIVRISGGARLLLHCLTELSQRLSVLLTILHLPPHSTLFLYAVRLLLFLFSIDIILAVALSSWLIVYHHPESDPAIRDRRQMLTDILLALPTRGSIVLIIVFSHLLLNFGTLYLNLSFLTFTTFLRLKGRSINTCGEVDLFMLRNFFLVIFFSFIIGFSSPFIPFFSFITLQLRLDKDIGCPSFCCC